jgi:hypothetical protein
VIDEQHGRLFKSFRLFSKRGITRDGFYSEGRPPMASGVIRAGRRYARLARMRGMILAQAGSENPAAPPPRLGESAKLKRENSFDFGGYAFKRCRVKLTVKFEKLGPVYGCDLMTESDTVLGKATSPCR